VLQDTRDSRATWSKEVEAAKQKEREKERERERERGKSQGRSERAEGDKGCNLIVNNMHAYEGQSKCVSLA
jgi:hypothetical protein